MTEAIVPKVGRDTICVDFDATLWGFGDLECKFSLPLPGAVEAMQALKAEGWRLVILTSRMSVTWWVDEAPRYRMNTYAFGRWQNDVVRDALNRAGIPFDRVTAEKVPAVRYIDDKAVHFDGDWPKAIAGLISTEAAAA